MNRLQKFRVWDFANKNMCYVRDNRQLRLYEDGSGSVVFMGPYKQESKMVKVSKENLMYGTGQPDKHKVAIYEGDISRIEFTNDTCFPQGLRNQVRIAQIKYDEDLCGYIAEWGYSHNTQNYISFDCHVACCSTVIGNIFETPDWVKLFNC